MESRLGDTQTKLEEAQTLAERAGELERELTAATARAEELHADIARSTAERDELQAELASVESRLGDTETKLAEVQERAKRAAELEDELTAATARAEELQAEIARSTTERDALQSDLAAAGPFADRVEDDEHEEAVEDRTQTGDDVAGSTRSDLAHSAGGASEPSDRDSRQEGHASEEQGGPFDGDILSELLAEDAEPERGVESSLAADSAKDVGPDARDASETNAFAQEEAAEENAWDVLRQLQELARSRANPNGDK